MKVDRLEAHDRLLHFKKDQWHILAQGIEDCLKKNPLSLAIQERSPYVYIFAHPRTADDGVNKRMYYQPRLVKPEAQTNSYLMRAQSKSDVLEICWFIPPMETWSQYKVGNVTESETVLWSIQQFKTNKKGLEAPDPQDLSEDKARSILREVIGDKIQEVRTKKPKLVITETPSFFEVK